MDTTKKICRINVVGTSGTGKTTFSKELVHLFHYPYIQMDELFWKPKWTMSTHEEFDLKLTELLEQPNWILDGNYNRTTPIKWAQVEMVIWLDYSFFLTLIRAIKRALWRSITREELWEGTGNRESFVKSFLSKDSIIRWTITSYGKIRDHYHQSISSAQYAHIKFVRLKNPNEAKRFLEQLKTYR